MHDAVLGVAACKADVASVARGGEQAGGELGGMVWVGTWRGRGRGFVGGSELGSCVQIVAAAVLGKVALGQVRDEPAAAAMPEHRAYGVRVAFAVSCKEPVAIAIDVGAFL